MRWCIRFKGYLINNTSVISLCIFPTEIYHIWSSRRMCLKGLRILSSKRLIKGDIIDNIIAMLEYWINMALTSGLLFNLRVHFVKSDLQALHYYTPVSSQYEWIIHIFVGAYNVIVRHNGWQLLTVMNMYKSNTQF